MTTGSTLNEAAKAIRRAGAASVTAAVLAHDH
jgi:predicted amidophosphoribosyltransferase